MHEDFPLTAAQNLLDEAADWLADTLLPPGHENRHCDDDGECRDGAADCMERAAHVLSQAAFETVEVGEETFEGGLRQPILEQRELDPELARAHQAVVDLTREFIAACRSGAAPAAGPELLAQLRQKLREQFAARLEGEGKAYRAMADQCDY